MKDIKEIAEKLRSDDAFSDALASVDDPVEKAKIESFAVKFAAEFLGTINELVTRVKLTDEDSKDDVT